MLSDILLEYGTMMLHHEQHSPQVPVCCMAYLSCLPFVLINMHILSKHILTHGSRVREDEQFYNTYMRFKTKESDMNSEMDVSSMKYPNVSLFQLVTISGLNGINGSTLTEGRNGSNISMSSSNTKQIRFNFTAADLINMFRSIFQNPKNFLPEPLTQCVLVTFIVLYCFIMALAVIGNAIVVLVIWKHRLRRTVTDVYICSLAISDLLIATLNMPFQLYFVIASEWLAEGKTGEILCKFTNYTQGVTIAASVLTLTAIAIDRYFVICRPFIAKKTHSYKSAMMCILTVWIIPLLALTPHLLYQKLDMRVRVSKHDIHIGWVCAEFYPNGKRDLELFSVMVYACLYCVPVISMAYAYGAIAHRLWVRHTIYPASQNPAQHDKNVAYKKKTTKLLLVLVAAFVVLWLPFFTFSIYYQVTDGNFSTLRIKMATLQLVGYSNSCVNPIIYTFLNSNFKKEFFRICRSLRLVRRKNVSSSATTDTESKF